MRRKQKIALYLVLIIISLAVLSSFIEKDSPTAEIAFRKKEKQQLVGPAEIVATMEVTHSWYNRMMVGVSEHGLTVFSWHGDQNFDGGLLRYYEKDGSVTIFCPCGDGRLPVAEDAQIPFFAITDHINAVSATLILELSYKGQTEEIELQAKRSEGGYFLFSLYRHQLSDETRRKIEITLSPNYVGGILTAQITLFDRNGIAVESRTVDLTQP